MKWYIVLGFLVYSLNSFGLSLQLGLGGLTPHFVTDKKNYCNQWNNTGIIANKSQYVRFLGDVYGLTYLRGHDSICSDIEGLFFHYIYSRSEWVETGITVGGYAFNEKNWDEHARTTPSGISAPEPVQIDYFGREVVPVVALDVGVHLIKQESWSLKLNNIFTPIIFNHSLAIEFKF